MTPEDVEALIARGEGQTIEFKTSLAETREAIESLCAMANSQGGVVLIGVSPDGSPKGVTIGSNTVENLVEDIKRHTIPRLLPQDIESVEIEGRHVLLVRVAQAPPGTVYYAYQRPLVRVGRTNQLMSPEEQRRKVMAGFRPEVTAGDRTVSGRSPSWREREARRVGIYERNRGLFLVHRWQPSQKEGQVADIQIELYQHGEGPLTRGTVREVHYHLGPKFTNRTIRKRNRRKNFRLEVSAYGPFLCLARVFFSDGSEPLDLERYVDFG